MLHVHDADHAVQAARQHVVLLEVQHVGHGAVVQRDIGVVRALEGQVLRLQLPEVQLQHGKRGYWGGGGGSGIRGVGVEPSKGDEGCRWVPGPFLYLL